MFHYHFRSRNAIQPGEADLYQQISEWEIPVGEDLVSQLAPPSALGQPYSPSNWATVPPDAACALGETVGLSQPRDLFVAPADVRQVSGAYVYSPLQVLAVGDRGVALWVDDLPFDRVACVLGYHDILLIEHRLDDHSGHLTIIGDALRFTLHYRRSSWLSLDELLLRIRRRTARTPETDVGLAAAAWSVTWSALATSALVTLGAPGPSRSVSAGFVPKPKRLHAGKEWPPCSAALTERELVLVRDAGGRLPLQHGVVLITPRDRLTQLNADGNRLRVHAGTTAHTFEVGERFATAVVQELAGSWTAAAECTFNPRDSEGVQ